MVTVESIEFQDETGNTLAETQTNVILPNGSLPNISGYELTTDPTDGAGVQKHFFERLCFQWSQSLSSKFWSHAS